MRLISQHIERKTGEGRAVLLPEEPEDLVTPDDSTNPGGLTDEHESGSGSRSNERVHTTLTIRVTKLDFDPQAAQLHVSGRVAEENKHVKLGSFHTLDLELQRNFTLEKAEGWDSVALDTLKEAVNQDAKVQLWAVIMKEGLANICPSSPSSKPKPRQAQPRELLPKITVAQSASGHLHSLNEVLSSPAVTAKLSDTKFARETQLVDHFFTLIRKEDNRAWYGPRESEKAVEQGAVGKGGGVLLISNGLFRSQEIEVRKRWVKLVDEVKEQGGEVRVLSSMHESGRRLESLGGVAVICTWPIEDLDEGEVEEEEEVHENGDGDGEWHENGDSHGIEGRVEHEEDIDFL
ncbi:Translation factor pelota [Friedmanniomyces endolithicus]|nr:Translation factor pelota [Friedmanniomyces endolithicus]